MEFFSKWISIPPSWFGLVIVRWGPLMPRRRKESELARGFSGMKEKPQQRNAANARERARMRVLSKAFCRLKTTLPWVPPDTKLSKLDTLRLATSYIAHLRAILTDEAADVAPIHPLNLVSSRRCFRFIFYFPSQFNWLNNLSIKEIDDKYNMILK